MIAYLFQCKIVINNAAVGFIQMELHCYSKKIFEKLILKNQERTWKRYHGVLGHASKFVDYKNLLSETP